MRGKFEERKGPDRGTELAAEFNNAIVRVFANDPAGVSAMGCAIACLTILREYIGWVPDKKWKRDLLDKIWDDLYENWGLK